MAVFDVTDYGADPTGVADSTSDIQDAINAAGAAGGGTVLLDGDFLLATRNGTASGYWCLDPNFDNLTFEITGTLTINTPAGASALFFVSGAIKAARTYTSDPDNWQSYWLCEVGGVQNTTLYDLDPTERFAKGSSTVILDDPADAANISIGDWILIRTGQTFTPGVGQPDAELQVVSGVNPSTGEIGLSSGLKTDYAQEYYVAGTSGETTVIPTANAAPFAVAVATDRLTSNLQIQGGGRIEQTTQEFVITGGGGVTFGIEDLYVRCNKYGLTSWGLGRDHTVNNCTVEIYNTWQAAGSWWLAASVGSTDFDWNNLTLIADFPTNLHIHEGCGRIHFRNSELFTPSVSGAYTLASITARHYDIDLRDSTFIGGGENTAIYVDTTSKGAGELSGRVQGCRFSNTTGAIPFALAPYPAPGWSCDALDGYPLAVPASTFVHAAGGVQ